MIHLTQVVTPDESDLISNDPSVLPGLLAAVMAGLAILGVVFVIAYVTGAILTMLLAKRLGHQKAWKAWVPILNLILLLELGGIRKAWAWVLIILAGFFLGGFIPVVGFVLSLAVAVLTIMLMVWNIRAIHAGLGMEPNAGRVVFGVLLGLPWMIWMIVRADKVTYDVNAAVAVADTFPLTLHTEDTGGAFRPFGLA